MTETQAIAVTKLVGTRINKTSSDAAAHAAEPWSATALPLDGTRVSPLVRSAVLILFGAVLFVLLIACVCFACFSRRVHCWRRSAPGVASRSRVL